MALSFRQRLAITGDIRQEWYRALASVSRNGQPMVATLQKMGKAFEKTKHPLAPAIEVILYRLRGGGPSHPGVIQRTFGTEVLGIVPREEAMLIQSGERSGSVANGFENAASALEAKQKMSGLVIGVLTRPIGYFFFLLAMFVFFKIKLIPQFEATHPRAGWPRNALLLGWVTDHIYFIIAIAASALAGLVYFFIKIVPRWTGSRRERADRYFPMNIVASLNGVDFLRSLSGYIDAGISFSEALTNMKAAGTPYMAWQCEKVLGLMRDGERVESALPRLTIVPVKYHWIIDVYSLSKDATTAYTTMATHMTERVTKVIQRVFGWGLGNLIFVFIGLTLFLVWSTFFSIGASKTVNL